MTRAWAAVLLVGAGSYLLRLVPLLLSGRLAVPDRAMQVLRDAGVAAVTTLLVGSLRAGGQGRDAANLAALAVSLIVAGGLAVTGRGVVVVVTAGGATYALGTWLVGSVTGL
jgi:branched-subunit amino acid transport protein